jgi:site-specific DNA-cytosine methylase
MNFKMPQDITFSEDWRSKKLLYPTRTIQLATMFSGIGAIEFALKRLRLKTNIIFASDNDKFVKQSYFKNYDIDDSRLARSLPSSVGTHTRTQLFKKYKNSHIHSHAGAMGAS